MNRRIQDQSQEVKDIVRLDSNKILTKRLDSRIFNDQQDPEPDQDKRHAALGFGRVRLQLLITRHFRNNSMSNEQYLDIKFM